MAVLGAHVSVAGGLHKAFKRGQDIHCDSLQIFVKNANRWQAKPLETTAAETFKQQRLTHNTPPVIAHASYLINLCSDKADTLEKSRHALLDELQRCDQLGLDGLVLHPGAHVGQGEEAGLRLITQSLNNVLAKHTGNAKILLENTAGQGSVLGYRFEQLASIITHLDTPERVGICLDTCHAFAAGYPLNNKNSYEQLIDTIHSSVGLNKLLAVHLNDSKFACGERKDRHESIGEGEIGLDFFARLVHDARFVDVPMILETPLGDDAQGHARDLVTLRDL